MSPARPGTNQPEHTDRQELRLLWSRLAAPGALRWYAALALCGLHAILLFRLFLPNLSDIGPFDESVYINSGRQLVEGRLPNFANNPLTALLYAITYLPVQNTLNWLIHSCTLGRIALFGLLWSSALLVSSQLPRRSHLLIMAGLLFVTPTVSTLLKNPSDALFAALSGFVLWQTLRFRATARTQHLWVASLFVGLAALARNDGLILFVTLALAALVVNASRQRTVSLLAATVIPFSLTVGGYLLLYGAVTGRYELGLSYRTYLAFEQGQGVAYSHLYTTNPFVEGQIEARRLFGTPEQNKNSVLKAISRNPRAFAERVLQIAKTAPGQAISAFGSLGIFLLLFFLRGVVRLAQSRSYRLLAVLLLWPAHLLSYLMTFFRPGYFLLPFVPAFALAAMGIEAMTANISRASERCAWGIGVTALAAYAALTSNLTLFFRVLILASGLLAATLAAAYTDRRSSEGSSHSLALVILLCAALLIKEPFATPSLRKLGVNADERAAIFMARNLEPKSRVAAYAPGKVWAAKMEYVPMYLSLRDLASKQDLFEWLARASVDAIYVDQGLRQYEPSVWALIQEHAGGTFKTLFRSADSQIQILAVPKDLLDAASDSAQ